MVGHVSLVPPFDPPQRQTEAVSVAYVRVYALWSPSDIFPAAFKYSKAYIKVYLMAIYTLEGLIPKRKKSKSWVGGPPPPPTPPRSVRATLPRANGGTRQWRGQAVQRDVAPVLAAELHGRVHLESALRWRKESVPLFL